MIYADSSFIVSAYTKDANAETAMAYLERHKPRLPFVFLHWPEIASAFWKFHPNPEKRWAEMEADIAAGKKMHTVETDPHRVARRAAAMMKRYASRWPVLRSLDVMHVAAAQEMSCKLFLSFDTSSAQRILAHVQGLKVWPELTTEEKGKLKAWS